MKKALGIFLLCVTILLAGLIIADAQSFRPVLFKLSAIKDVSSVDATDGYYLKYDGTAGTWGPAELVVPPSTPVFTDNFADAAIYWAWKTDETDANKTIVEAGGLLTIEVKNNVIAVLNDSDNMAPKIFTGVPGYPCEVITKLNDYTVNDKTAAGLFIAMNPITNTAQGFYGICRLKSTVNGRDGISMIDIAHISGGLADAAVATLPIWLKIRIKAHAYAAIDILFYYSEDGINYTLLYTLTPWAWINTKDPAVIIGLIANNTAITSNIAAPFEFITITQDSGPGCP